MQMRNHTLNIRRASLYEDAFEQLGIQGRGLRSIRQGFRVSMIDEHVRLAQLVVRRHTGRVFLKRASTAAA